MIDELDHYYYTPTAIGVLSFLFFAIPGSVLLLSFSGVAFLQGEVWRILTFPFAHTSSAHLLENMGALAVISMLSYCVDLSKKEFLGVFIGANLLIAIAELFFFPALVIAGASLGIFGLLGALGVHGATYLPKPTYFLLLASPMFYKYAASAAFSSITVQVVNQTFFHAAGFAGGILTIYILRISQDKKVLTRGTD